MKEYLLIPKSEVPPSMLNKSQPENLPKVTVTTTEQALPQRTQMMKRMMREMEKDSILENASNFPPELVLKLYEHAKKMENIPEDDARNINKKKSEDEIAKKSLVGEGYEIQGIINTLPENFREMGKQLFDELSKIEGLSIDKYGMLSLEGFTQNARLEDLLRGFLVKKARVDHIKPFVNGLLPYVPDHLIRNDKVSVLKPVGSGHKKPRKKRVITVPNDWIRWL